MTPDHLPGNPYQRFGTECNRQASEALLVTGECYICCRNLPGRIEWK